MIRAKPHLKNLYRTIVEDKPSRLGFLRLDMNEGIPGLSEDFVKRVLSEVGAENISMYPEYNQLIKKVAGHNGIGSGNVCLSNGSDAAIKYIFDAYVSKGDKVLLTEPTFAMYPVYCRMYGAKAIIAEYGDDLEFPVDDFMRKLTRGVRMAVIVNPNNPAGTALDRKDLMAMIGRARQKDILIVVDEAYFYFYPETVIKEINRYKNLIVLRTFSKLCGIAALRLGYAVACPEIIEGLRKVKPTYDVNGIAVKFTERLFDKEAVIKSMIHSVNDGRNFLAGKLRAEGISYRMGHANFVLVRCGKTASRIIESLNKKRILVGGPFRQGFLKDYIRITIGDRDSMSKLWNVFIKIWRKERR